MNLDGARLGDAKPILEPPIPPGQENSENFFVKMRELVRANFGKGTKAVQQLNRLRAEHHAEAWWAVSKKVGHHGTTPECPRCPGCVATENAEAWRRQARHWKKAKRV